MFKCNGPKTKLNGSATPFTTSHLFGRVGDTSISPSTIPRIGEPPNFLHADHATNTGINVYAVSVNTENTVSKDGDNSIPNPFTRRLLTPIRIPVARSTGMIGIKISEIIFVALWKDNSSFSPFSVTSASPAVTPASF